MGQEKVAAGFTEAQRAAMRIVRRELLYVVDQAQEQADLLGAPTEEYDAATLRSETRAAVRRIQSALEQALSGV